MRILLVTVSNFMSCETPSSLTQVVTSIAGVELGKGNPVSLANLLTSMAGMYGLGTDSLWAYGSDRVQHSKMRENTCKSLVLIDAR